MSDFKRVPNIKDPYDYIDNHPWDIAQAPFRIAPTSGTSAATPTWAAICWTPGRG